MFKYLLLLIFTVGCVTGDKKEVKEDKDNCPKTTLIGFSEKDMKYSYGYIFHGKASCKRYNRCLKSLTKSGDGGRYPTFYMKCGEKRHELNNIQRYRYKDRVPPSIEIKSKLDRYLSPPPGYREKVVLLG